MMPVETSTPPSDAPLPTLLPLLILNPNTTTSMTTSLSTLLEPHTALSRRPTEFFTAPSGVSSINTLEDCYTSSNACLESMSTTFLSRYSGFIVACFSDHPLIHQLKQRTSHPVLGIFEAAIVTCIFSLGRPVDSKRNTGPRFGIITTGPGMGTVLDSMITSFLGAESNKYAGAEECGVHATDLHDWPKEIVVDKIKSATKRLLARGGEVGAICLGCAGMSWLDEVVKEACIEALGDQQGRKVKIVDGTKAAWGICMGLVEVGV